ncbi:MAG: hypothetical protein QM784_29410 [Polyangiaceae bacterium]
MTATPLKAPTAPTTILGDWYANVTDDGHILCVSEQTLLPIVLPREALPSLATELPRAVSMVLAKLGVDEAAIQRERFAMAQVAVSTTASRRVLGFLKEFAFLLEAAQEGASLIDRSLWLAHTPCNASSRDAMWPDEATRAAFTNTDQG